MAFSAILSKFVIMHILMAVGTVAECDSREFLKIFSFLQFLWMTFQTGYFLVFTD
jgi:hypothetical protein